MMFDMTKRKGGGGYTADDWTDRNMPVGEVKFKTAAIDNNYTQFNYFLYGRKGITTVDFGESTWLSDYLLVGSSVNKIIAPNVTKIGASGCTDCTRLEYVVLPSLIMMYASVFKGCTNIKAVDIGGTADSGQGFARGEAFSGDTKLNIVVLRANSVYPLSQISCFTNTPFASGKAGGTLYVPASLISSYESATNWSTILGYPNNQIKSIESTHTDPNAPVDLTLYYVDGTPIPTA